VEFAAPSAEARSFGKYTLVAKLATGGMAEIFLARLEGDGGFEKLICIKRILAHLAKDAQFVAMFLDEARIVARISHPNVCQVFELGEWEGQYYIAMEYLEGLPLSRFRRNDTYPSPPDPQLVAGFGVQACEGLHHAHQLKRADGTSLEVVHRDISAQNLFVTVDGIVKLLDFGIAKVQDASTKTSTGAVKGTYAYMAPEQLRGETLDRRTDVFALGIVLWETLAQRHLFKRETDFLTFQAITSDPIPDVCEVRPDVPPELGATLAMALARDPSERFANARAFGEALARAVSSLGGVYTPAMISVEFTRAFKDTLHNQRELLQEAREGRAWDLDEENPLGEQMTTPVSNLYKRGLEAQAEVAELIARQGGGMRRDPTPLPKRALSPRSQPMLVATPPKTATMQVELPRTSKLLWFVGIAGVLLALAAIAAAGYLYMQHKQEPAVAVAPVAPAPVPVPVPVPVPTPVVADAAVAVAPPPIDAGVVAPDAAEAASTVTPPTPTHPDKRPPAVKPHPQPAQPSGPPGFITIDSNPFATIAVDGRRLGETPLVNVSLGPGRHTVRATLSSGASRAQSITIESGKTAPPLRLEW